MSPLILTVYYAEHHLKKDSIKKDTNVYDLCIDELKT